MNKEEALEALNSLVDMRGLPIHKEALNVIISTDFKKSQCDTCKNEMCDGPEVPDGLYAPSFTVYKCSGYWGLSPEKMSDD